jgi:hypothetical protein
LSAAAADVRLSLMIRRPSVGVDVPEDHLIQGLSKAIARAGVDEDDD